MKDPWFGPKSYGIGLSPRGWKGWTATFFYLVLMTAAGFSPPWLAAHHQSPFWTLGALLALTIVFSAVIALTADRSPWRWRSGGGE